MTVLDIPEATVSVGGTAIATENIMEVHLHLGCTKEVSTFEVVVDNSNPDYHEADYSPGGDKEFTKGNEVIVKCTRGTISGSTPALLTGTLESLEYIDQAEDYQYKDIVVLRGRCKGWQLFARKYDGDLSSDVGILYKSYKRAAGEAESMIAYLIDNYTETPLSHSRVNSVATANAASGQKVVAVTDGTKFAADDLVKIKDDNNWEYNKVASVSVNNVTMVSNLLENYTTAANLTVYLDLIKDSNTIYTKMLFSHETVFDIIKFISDTASTSGGAIGYDSRVDYDGKYAWLPRGNITESNFDLTAEVQLERFLDDATRIKNKITVYGKPDKPYPLDTDGQTYSDALSEDYDMERGHLAADAAASQKDITLTAGDVSGMGLSADDYIWILDTSSTGEYRQVDSIAGEVLTLTEDLTNAYTTANHAIVFKVSSTLGYCYAPVGAWDSHMVARDNTIVHTGSNSIKINQLDSVSYSRLYYVRLDDEEIDLDKYPDIHLKAYFTTTAPRVIYITLISGTGTGSYTGTNYALSSPIAVDQPDQWVDINVKGGSNAEGAWVISGAFDWTTVKVILIYVAYAAAGTHVWYIDRFYFGGRRWGGGSDNATSDGFAEDSTSQSTYGTKEYVIVNDMLLSDKECESKAQGLLAFYKNPRSTYELETETLDWGDYPIYPGNKISIDLTPLSITGDKRVDCVDIHLTSVDHKLTANFTIEDTPPRRADYLYNLSKRLRQLERAYLSIR